MGKNNNLGGAFICINTIFLMVVAGLIVNGIERMIEPHNGLIGWFWHIINNIPPAWIYLYLLAFMASTLLILAKIFIGAILYTLGALLGRRYSWLLLESIGILDVIESFEQLEKWDCDKKDIESLPFIFVFLVEKSNFFGLGFLHVYIRTIKSIIRQSPLQLQP